MKFTANKFGTYTCERYSIRPILAGSERIWRAARGRHLIGDFPGPKGLEAAQVACKQYLRDNRKAVRAFMRSRGL